MWRIACLLFLLNSDLFFGVASDSLKWNEIAWVEGLTGESQVDACRRNALLPLDMDSQPYAWNQTVFNSVVFDVLNKSIADSANGYGILGCCAPGLWCNGTSCFTQNFGDHFANYGPLPASSSLSSSQGYRPVYTCWQNTSDVESVVLVSYRQSSGNIFLYGANFGDTNIGLNVPVDGYRCENAGLCDCVPCGDSSHSCPVGSSCRFSSVYGYSCFPICAGTGDKACPCGQVCTSTENVFGELISLCLPTNSSTVNVCMNSGGNQLMCQAGSALAALPSGPSESLNISLAVDDTGDSLVVPYLNARLCSSDSDCYDGNICTLDQCSLGRCNFTMYNSCSTILPTVMEQYTPYTYIPLQFTDNVVSSVAAFITATQPMKTLTTPSSSQGDDSTTSSSSMTMPFYFLFFGGLLNQIRVYGNGMLALPPYSSCPAAKCGVFSTATNLAAPLYNPLWRTIRYWTYSQKQNVSEPFFGVNANAFHVLMNATTDTSASGPYSTFLVSMYQDGSVRFSYDNAQLASGAGVYRGLWGSVATGVSTTANYLRYNQEELQTNLSSVSLSDQAVAFCYLNSTACIPEACVRAGSQLEINWNVTSTCNALGNYADNSAMVRHRCVWYGGVDATDAVITEAVTSATTTGIVSCPVPTLAVSDGTIVPVDLVTVYTVGGSEVSSSQVGIADGQRNIYSVTLGMDGELARSNLLVRWYSSSASTTSCGCSAVHGSQSYTCDAQGVCGGMNDEGDCMETPFGSAFRDACGICSAGYTKRIPVFVCAIVDSQFISIISQTIVLLIIICCMTIITSTVSYIIRRMLVRRARHDAMMIESEFATQMMQADGLPTRQRRGLSEFECEALGQHTFTKAFWLKHKATARTSDSTSNAESNDVSSEAQGEACDCSICLSDIAEGSQVRILPEPCGHIFHLDCIDQWFKQSYVCPLCKRSMRSILVGDEESGPGGNATGDRYQALQREEARPAPARAQGQPRYYNTNLHEHATLALFRPSQQDPRESGRRDRPDLENERSARVRSLQLSDFTRIPPEGEAGRANNQQTTDGDPNLSMSTTRNSVYHI